MNKFEDKIKPLLTYIGAIGATLMAIAYVVLVFVLIVGFKVSTVQNTTVFSFINAAVGLVICNMLKYQGISLAKVIPENKEVEARYYGNKTKDKKNHSLKYFWTTTLIKDILIKGITIGLTTFGVIYLVIVGSQDWSLLLMAVVNLIMFICFGLLSLNKAYDYYNTTYVAYMKEQINERTEIFESRGDCAVPVEGGDGSEDREIPDEHCGTGSIPD